MPQVHAHGITIEYESFGRDTDPAILLIMGYAAQLTRWPVELCEALAARGYRVIRFDNRDIGLSSKFEASGLPDIPGILAALGSDRPPDALYRLDDMAADAVGLMDELGIRRAHIVGASMGGMIGQLLVAHYPDRALSFTCIMSSSGNPDLPKAAPEVMALIASQPDPGDVEAIIERGVKLSRLIGSTGYPEDEGRVRERIHSDYRRSYVPSGPLRQMAAVLASGDRRGDLKRIRSPTVVLHGASDGLVPVDAGRDIAANIAGAELRIIEGMGHDFSPGLIPIMVDAILAAVAKATAPSSS